MSEARQGARYGTPNVEYARKMLSLSPEEDGPVYMVNLMKYRAQASYADGRTDVRSGREADDLYAPIDVLAAIGAEVVFVGTVEEQLEGSGDPWERIGIVRYATRRSFLEMQRRPDFQEKHVHKEAGMERTIVMGCLPESVSRGSVAQPSGEGRPLVLMSVTKWAGEPKPADSALPETVLRVEGTILGDGRAWDEVRFSHLPAGASREEIVAAARAEAADDRYVMVVRAGRDVLAARIEGA